MQTVLEIIERLREKNYCDDFELKGKNTL